MGISLPSTHPCLPLWAERTLVPLLRFVRDVSQHPPFRRAIWWAIQIVEQEKRCDVVCLSSGRGHGDGGVGVSKWVAEIRNISMC